jgi:lipopolysaccharide biosynthesis glycosyltransferase
MIRIFIGYDSKAPVLYNVLQHSIQVRCSEPVSITPLMLSQLKSVHSREKNPLASTEFSFTRFLVPYLSEYEGWSLFIDNDMVMIDDVAKLWSLRNEKYSIMCTKHNYSPKEDVKFLGTTQTKYEKKNWSSCILFNNAKCKSLTPEYVNTASGLNLHQFKWLASDDEIGSIPLEWNYLADTGQVSEKKSMIHYTLGGPYFKEYINCEEAKVWIDEKESMLSCAQVDGK